MRVEPDRFLPDEFVAAQAAGADAIPKLFFSVRRHATQLAGPLGLHVSSVGLSDAQTRWGSCGSNGRILLNWRLMMLAPNLIDYVAAHELAHLRELNHSPRFWDIVALLYPDHRAARRELNSRAPTLPDL